jgi:hypothetical protein
MEQLFDVAVVAGYSLILTWVVDFLSKTSIGKYIEGPYKQLLSGIIAAIYCISTNTCVIGSGISGQIMSGLLLSSAAGVGWSKVNNLLSVLKNSFGR